MVPSSNPRRDCISLRVNNFGKGMNPIILPIAMGKIVGQTVLLNLVMTSGLEGKF